MGLPRRKKREEGDRPGRPLEFTAERRELFLAAIREGVGPRAAAGMARVNYNTPHNWRKRGEAEWDRLEAEPESEAPPEELPYLEFAVDYAAARASAEHDAVTDIKKAGKDPRNWTARAWFLERTNREDWGKRETQVQESDVRVEVVYVDAAP